MPQSFKSMYLQAEEDETCQHKRRATRDLMKSQATAAEIASSKWGTWTGLSLFIVQSKDSSTWIPINQRNMHNQVMSSHINLCNWMHRFWASMAWMVLQWHLYKFDTKRMLVKKATQVCNWQIGKPQNLKALETSMALTSHLYETSHQQERHE